MPGIVSGGSPYPKVSDVMNLARVRVNDTAMSIDGDLLANDQPYTGTLLNAAWRWLQTKASVSGIETPIREFNVTGFPAALDTTEQSWIGWGGSGSGGANYNDPQLPEDMILPMNVWVDYGSGYMSEMQQADEGLPVLQEWNVYDWRQDGLYFYGSQQPLNLRIRYQSFLADLSLTDPTAIVPMMFCQDALSARVAFEFSNARGSAQAAALAALAEDAFGLISQRTGRKNQRRNLRRQSFSGYGEYSNPWPIIR